MRHNKFSFQRTVVLIAFLIVCLTIPSFAETAYQISIKEEEDNAVGADKEELTRKSEKSAEIGQGSVVEDAVGNEGDEKEQSVASADEEDSIQHERSSKETAREEDAVADLDVLEEEEAEKPEKGDPVEEKALGDLGEEYARDWEDYTFSRTGKRLYQDWVAGHFEIALRYTTYEFDRSSESSRDDEYFIGSIDTLKEEDPGFGLHNIKLSWFPLTDCLEWLPESDQEKWRWVFAVIEGIGVELTWDNLQAKTWTSVSERHPRAYTDGTIEAEGPMLSVVLDIENSTPVTPYLGFGTADYNDLNVTEGWWHYGYSGSNPEEEYQQWRDAGSPGDPNNGYRRTFTVDPSTGSFWYIGAKVAVYENLSLDVFYRETEVEFDNTYTLAFGRKVVDTRYSKWDLSNKTYGLGILYRF